MISFPGEECCWKELRGVDEAVAPFVSMFCNCGKTARAPHTLLLKEKRGTRPVDAPLVLPVLVVQ